VHCPQVNRQRFLNIVQKQQQDLSDRSVMEAMCWGLVCCYKDYIVDRFSTDFREAEVVEGLKK
jgi:hypothetical protein